MWMAPLLLAAPLVVVLLGSSARADSCRVMTVRYGVSGTLVVLDPDHYDLPYGGCVQFVNQTAATTTVTVGSRYVQDLGPNENTSGSSNFRGTTPGRFPVTATSGPTGNRAHGTLTVAAAPHRSPPPSSPHPSKTSTPAPPASPASSSGGGPQVAPTPSRSHGHGHRRGHQRGGLQPPVSPPGPVQIPTFTPTPAPTAIVSGPVEPASGRGKGLPAALAALGVVGGGAAFIRVLAAEPVEDGQNVGGSS